MKNIGFSISQWKYIVARTTLMGTSKWIAVPLNVHCIRETRNLYTSLKVIYLGHIKFSQ